MTINFWPILSHAQLLSRRTQERRFDSDLKYWEGRYRIWLRRGNKTAIVEQLESGRWRLAGEYQAT